MEPFFDSYKTTGFSYWNGQGEIPSDINPLIIHANQSVLMQQTLNIVNRAKERSIYIVSEDELNNPFEGHSNICFANEVECKRRLTLELLHNTENAMHAFLEDAVYGIDDPAAINHYIELRETRTPWIGGLSDAIAWLEVAFGKRIDKARYDKIPIQHLKPMTMDVHKKCWDASDTFFKSNPSSLDRRSPKGNTYCQARAVAYLWSICLGATLSDVKDLYTQLETYYLIEGGISLFETDQSFSTPESRMLSFKSLCKRVNEDKKLTSGFLMNIESFETQAVNALTLLHNSINYINKIDGKS